MTLHYIRSRITVLLAALTVLAIASCATGGSASDAVNRVEVIRRVAVGSPGDPGDPGGVAAATPDEFLHSLASLLPTPAAGMMVATVDEGGIVVASLGAPAFTEATLFEYASITKVFTALLLSQLVEAGVVELDAPVTGYLPDELRFPQWDRVTLRALATHTAGVPSLPPNLGVVRLALTGRGRDPYAHYGRAELIRGAGRARIADKPVWAYSNFGYAMLGEALAGATRVGYGELVTDRILRPLHMEDATLGGWSSGLVAPPLTRRGGRAKNWSLDAFAPAGALRGSIDDGLRFLLASVRACSASDELSVANCAAQQPSGAIVGANTEMGLGWLRSAASDATVIWHNGGTGGYSTFLGFSPDTGRGVVVLANVANLREIDAMAMQFVSRP